MLKLKNVNVRKFRLSEQFIAQYKEAEVPWGPVGYVSLKKVLKALKNGGKLVVVLLKECLIYKKDMLS